MSELAQLASLQHGAVSRRQALASGVSSSGIGRRLEAGIWKAVDDGVYLLPGARRSWQQQAMVACLATQGCASHLTAGTLWGLPVPKASRLDVLVPAARRPRSTRGIRVHRTRAPMAPQLRSGIPTAPLKDTLIQLAEVLAPRALEAAIDAALKQRPGILYDLADTLVEARRGHRASLKFRALIVELLPDDGARAALPAGRTHPGLDVAWPERRLGVALFDHRDQGQGRALDALADQGWTVLVTHAHESPNGLAKRLAHFR